VCQSPCRHSTTPTCLAWPFCPSTTTAVSYQGQWITQCSSMSWTQALSTYSPSTEAAAAAVAAATGPGLVCDATRRLRSCIRWCRARLCFTATRAESR
jgi:hypothetical protein